ncbi:hypothetical protein BNJ_00197 [Kaumoebavirus]|uniref:hypothetical protein n=1 Tax=Kaumoebavirus TaxID=1859492 RepID=UPI0009C325C6|nr:hypothetical protein BNJ_00197 [Kaumoebavirus]ARA72028.1 hypothetical protein BNJ_00197 [Kaumoebavirus]
MAFNYKSTNFSKLAEDLSHNLAPYQVSADEYGIAVFAANPYPVLAFAVSRGMLGIKKIAANDYNDFLKFAVDEISNTLFV